MAESTIITSLCWISRGYAKQTVQEYEPNENEKQAYQKIQKEMKK